MEQKKRKRVSKIQLEELRVQSFLTELKPDVAFTAKGGDDQSLDGWCTVISTVLSAIISNSGASKWPCRSACATQPSGGGSGGGGTPSDTSPWSC